MSVKIQARWLWNGVLLFLLLVSASASPARPNILFILCDDLGYGDFGVFLQNQRRTQADRTEPWHFTPELDRLATEGARLPHHYCPAPVCAPSRASLLTGVHQGHATVRDNQFDKALENNHTIATVLKQAGYATACIGKWGLQGSGSSPATWPAYPTKRGFDYFFGYVRHADGHEHYPKEGLYRGAKEVYDGASEISAQLDKCYTADLFTARAKKWISDQLATNPAQPFFLFLSFDTPHAVLELPTQAYPAGGGANGGLQWLGTPGAMINTASGTIDSYLHPDYATATWDHDTNAATAEQPWPDVFKRYATDVRRIDECVGDLRQLLRDLNLETNTLVVFTSDNGPSQESYLTEAYEPWFFNSFGPFDGIKRDCWEGGIRVGALARWPGSIPANRECLVPSQFHDWLPTFCELAGLPAPARCDGVSLVPDLTGSGAQRAPTVYVEYYESGSTPSYAEFAAAKRGRRRNQQQMLRLGDLVGVRYNVAAATNDFEIYHVPNDPKQTNNLASQPGYAGTQAQMKKRVLQLRRPDPEAVRSYDNALLSATDITMLTNGVIDCATYLGAWPWVPDFDALVPLSTNRVNGFTLEARPSDTNFGLGFRGFIEAPFDGEYTFYLTSDSGAILRLHDTRLIDDDFDHTGAERSAKILLQAGRHPFRLFYRHASGSMRLELKYAGPGLPKQAIPASALFAISDFAGPPLAGGDLAVTTRNIPVTVDVLANDRDDGLPAPLALTGFTQPECGVVSTNGSLLIYTPQMNFLGEDSFSYFVTDGQFTSTGSVRVSVCFEDGLRWYPFNQTSGLTTAEAGGSRAGTLMGFDSETAQWVDGRFNRGLLFDGTNDYVSLTGFNGITGATARTLSAWLKTTNSGVNRPIIAWGPNTTGNKWTFLMNTTGQIRLEITGGYVVGTRAVNDGLWHHVACAFTNDGSPNVTDVKLYVDGTNETLSTSQATAINTTGTFPVKIGSDVQNRFWAGVLDEVRIEDRALSAAEIAALAAATNQSAAAWHRRFFGDAPANWGDLDGGSVPRIIKYALSGQPHRLQEPRALFQPEFAAGEITVRFMRRVAGTHELRYRVRVSPDLRDWDSLTASEVDAQPSPNLSGFEEVRFRPNASASYPSLFLKLEVSLP